MSRDDVCIRCGRTGHVSASCKVPVTLPALTANQGVTAAEPEGSGDVPASQGASRARAGLLQARIAATIRMRC